MHEQINQWLARTLSGERLALPAAADAGAVTAAAIGHGIAVAIHTQLDQAGWPTSIPGRLREDLATAARAQAQRSLWLEAETRRIVAAFSAAACPLLLLKGSALAWWRYPRAVLREGNDIDLLVAPDRAQAAASLLAGLGYCRLGLPLPGDLCGFEATLTPVDSQRPRLEVDLHWALCNIPVFAFRFDFDAMYKERIALPGLGPDVFGLGPVHAFMHAAMHRVGNFPLGVGERLKWLYDLDQLGRGFTHSQWQQLQQLACDRGLAGCCLDGLRATARYFGAVAPDQLLADLQRSAASETIDPGRMHRRGYVEWMNFRALPGAGRKLRWLRQRLWPSVEYRRARYGDRFGRAFAARLLALWRRLVRHD